MPSELPAGVRKAAESARGFMPPAEGEALYDIARAYAGVGPIAEIGTYCGKSTIYLAAAASAAGQLVLHPEMGSDSSSSHSTPLPRFCLPCRRWYV